MVSALPLCAAFVSNNNQKYLTYVKERAAHNHLSFSGEEIVSRSTKFAIEKSSKHKSLVHIRCCHNNKYLVKKSQQDQWIMAASQHPEEDQSLWSSTLFEPIIIEDEDGYGRVTVKFKHVHTGSCLSLNKLKGIYNNSLYLSNSNKNVDYTDLITVIDWGTLVILPKRVILKSSAVQSRDTKNFISSSSNGRTARPCLQSYADDNFDARVIHEVVNNSDGTIRVKCGDEGCGFWTSNVDGALDIKPLHQNNNYNYNNSMKNGSFQKFMPIKMSSTAIALRSLPLNKFCVIDRTTQQLCCKANSILREAIFEVEEVVTSREIYNIKYYLEDARIYDVINVDLGTRTINNTTESAYASKSSFRFHDLRSSTWKNNCSLDLGVQTFFRLTKKPFITENGIVVDGGMFNGAYQWGETHTETTQKQQTFNVSVPAMSKGIHRLVCKRGSCDVPFSYSVREVYIDGETMEYTMDDGVYTGMNSFQILREIEFNDC